MNLFDNKENKLKNILVRIILFLLLHSALILFSGGKIIFAQNSEINLSEEDSIKNADRHFLIKGLRAQESQNPEAKKYSDEAWNDFYQSDYSSAIMNFEKAHQIDSKTPDPNNPDFYWILGVILGKRGNPDGAIAIYQKGLAVSPNNSQLICAIGYGYEHKYFNSSKKDAENLKITINYYEKGVEADPKSSYCQGYLTQAYYYAGNYAEAWKQVNIAETQGIKPPFEFIQALTQKMPNPGK